MSLGPLVPAQQVLDPSPQTSHPREEKNGAPPMEPSTNLRYDHEGELDHMSSSEGALEISSVIGQPPSLVADLFGSLRVVQNPTNVMKVADLHPQDHSIQNFTDATNKGWGAHLEQAMQKVCCQTGKKGYT